MKGICHIWWRGRHFSPSLTVHAWRQTQGRGPSEIWNSVHTGAGSWFTLKATRGLNLGWLIMVQYYGALSRGTTFWFPHFVFLFSGCFVSTCTRFLNWTAYHSPERSLINGLLTSPVTVVYAVFNMVACWRLRILWIGTLVLWQRQTGKKRKKENQLQKKPFLLYKFLAILLIVSRTCFSINTSVKKKEKDKPQNSNKRKEITG